MTAVLSPLLSLEKSQQDFEKVCRAEKVDSSFLALVPFELLKSLN